MTDMMRDLALLSYDTGDIDAPPLTLTNSEDLLMGETIYVIGNSRLYRGMVSMGIVSGLRDYQGSEYIGRKIQIDAAISAGNSGSPIINAQGEVIAIAMETLASEGKTTQNMNFAIR